MAANDKPDGDGGALDPAVQEDLQRIAVMFTEYRDDPIMRELCRLAIKCAQERWIRGG